MDNGTVYTNAHFRYATTLTAVGHATLYTEPGIPAQTVSRTVGPEAIAPTIATFLGIKLPSGSVSEVLTEPLQGKTTEYESNRDRKVDDR